MSDDCSTKLLKYAYENYLNTNNLEYRHTYHNANENFFFSSAAEYLEEDGYVNIIETRLAYIVISLTSSGIEHCKRKF